MAGGKEGNEGLLRELAESRGRAQLLEAELAQKALLAQQLEARAAEMEARAAAAGAARGGGEARAGAGALVAGGGGGDGDMRGAVQQGLVRSAALIPLSRLTPLHDIPRPSSLAFTTDNVPLSRLFSEHRREPGPWRHPPRHERRGALPRHLPVVPPLPGQRRRGGADRGGDPPPGATETAAAASAPFPSHPIAT